MGETVSVRGKIILRSKLKMLYVDLCSESNALIRRECINSNGAIENG